ncbi:MAG: DUF1232 domain-containing protein [Bacteroidaceae bacterium]|nr:DUF1232 domain-containing protein [Bacteroidaceae bacterium]
MNKAKLYAFNPLKLKSLLLQLSSCMSRKGLLKIKDNLILIRDYLSDIATGKYKDYNGKKLILIVAAMLYVVTPFDLLPDFIPPGWIDDISIVAWAIKEASEELEKYKDYITKNNKL